MPTYSGNVFVVFYFIVIIDIKANFHCGKTREKGEPTHLRQAQEQGYPYDSVHSVKSQLKVTAVGLHGLITTTTTAFLCRKQQIDMHSLIEALPKRKKEWLVLLGGKDLLEIDINSTRFQSPARVCAENFSDWCFYSSLKSRLSQVALPEPPEPPCSSSLCLESPQMRSTDSSICSNNPALPSFSSTPKRPMESENLRSQR
ncbi:hypothetical protein JTE90_025559 [Oedothorax gibbosus]|uniref:Uncharacterized protein n=1 Tax=Oedothorax gibbosus TaxID=931172 RepID=A0AAV6TXN8_9ARAC|nr:hypothetical protein JTE90_025559 [Oedothorax gibbosus]